MAPGGGYARARPAHTPGPTFLCYTPNGRRLITAGANTTIRVFETGSDGEPVNIDDCQDGNLAVVASNDFFITGSEDGTVSLYSLETNAFDRILVRCTLPIRDLSLSPDRTWVAVASDELVVKVVNVQDMTRVRYLREQSKPVKHVSFDPSGMLLTVACVDGLIYVYSMASEEPELVRKVDGLIRTLESEEQATSKIAWHPDGRAFAAATATRDIQVMSKRDWERQRAFSNGHTADVTSLAWSPNGSLLVTAGADQTACLWDTKAQKVIKRYENLRASIWAFSWHPLENLLSYTNDEGELYMHNDFVPSEYVHFLQKDLQAAPFIHDPLSEISGNANRQSIQGPKDSIPVRVARRGTPDSLDDILGPDVMSDVEDFVEDDDGLGYAEEVNGHGKRTNGHLDPIENARVKRRSGYSSWQPRIHESFQPGSTPWRGNRRYLCLNLIGFVWTVDQDTHHTVTVEFYDREFQRDFHFTDTFQYDKACLTEKGTLFSSQPANDDPAMIHYRPHETWTARADWRSSLPIGESVTAIALSESYVVVTTSTNYVRIYTLFGTPIRVYRHKSSPIVTCVSWRDYVMTIGNGSVGGDGMTKLVYTIENIKRDDTCQSEDVVALTEGAQLQSVFFSDTGDPCIYDTTGVLLTLLHWRHPNQARWTPLLDTKALSRLATGRKQETYWPVAVASEKFHCIILKGGDRNPYFPRPLLTEFDFQIPLTSSTSTSTSSTTKTKPHSETETETSRLEELYVRHTLLHALHADLLSATHGTHAQRTDLARRALESDKVLLQLLAAECVEGEEKGMKALEIVKLLRDEGGTGRMLEAAGKVAGRFGREALRERIAEVAERRVVGLDGGEEGG